MARSRTILIDGDIFAYTAASTNQIAIDWDGEGATVYTSDDDLEAARARVESDIADIADRLKATRIVVCLSCPTAAGWRIRILPSYKQHRPSIKPVLLEPVKDFMRGRYETFERPTLEADDVMGILSTHPTLIPGEKVIVSIDKDMKTIPGFLFNPSVGTVERIEEHEADYWHLFQTLVGDATDGYSGCPRIGKTRAPAVLRGGDDEGAPTLEAMWARVLSAFEAKGLSYAYALTQARVARICRHTDYDFTNKEVILWMPPSPPQ